MHLVAYDCCVPRAALVTNTRQLSGVHPISQLELGQLRGLDHDAWIERQYFRADLWRSAGPAFPLAVLAKVTAVLCCFPVPLDVS